MTEPTGEDLIPDYDEDVPVDDGAEPADANADHDGPDDQEAGQ